MRGLKNRRGATMVLVGIALVALVGTMAFSLDFGRMYLYRAQVHVSADAAALAGAERLAKGFTGTAADTAVVYGHANLVENAVPTIAPADIVPGIWDFSASTFTPASGGSWTAAGVNAVQATSRYTANYTFGRIFGMTTSVRTATSIAAVGSVGATDCVRPWAIPYEDLLLSLYPSTSPGNPYNSAYELTAADVVTLSAFTSANSISLKYGTAAANGFFGAVKEPAMLTADGVSQTQLNASANDYRDMIGDACGTGGSPVASIGPGDWLEQNGGAMMGPSKQGVANLCTVNGNPASFACSPAQPIKLAIYSEFNSSTATANGVTKGCSPGCFKVKYIGVFAIIGWQKGPGTDPDLVQGYFSALATTGKFSGTPGPLKKIALVR